MRRVAVFTALFAALPLVGCGPGVRPAGVALSELGRVQALEITDAAAFDPRHRHAAFAPSRVTDPDRIAGVRAFLEARREKWERVGGEPRAVRFQVRLLSNERPVYTLWVEPGYAQLSAGGKDLKGLPLSGAESAELIALLGLPPGSLGGS